MKRLLFSIPMVIVMFLAFSCAIAPIVELDPQVEPAAQQAPKEKTGEEQGTQKQFDTAFRQVYETHQSNLILTGAQQYTVIKDDTPSKIAMKFYGNNNGYFFPIIILASKNVIYDPDLIRPGMTLVIPDLQRNLANTDARKGIKLFLRDVADVYAKKTNQWAPTIRRELIKLAESL
jgi:hypothetical protein